MLENVNENLTPRMRNMVAMLWSEWKDLELQIVHPLHSHGGPYIRQGKRLLFLCKFHGISSSSHLRGSGYQKR